MNGERGRRTGSGEIYEPHCIAEGVHPLPSGAVHTSGGQPADGAPHPVRRHGVHCTPEHAGRKAAGSGSAAGFGGPRRGGRAAGQAHHVAAAGRREAAGALTQPSDGQRVHDIGSEAQPLGHRARHGGGGSGGEGPPEEPARQVARPCGRQAGGPAGWVRGVARAPGAGRRRLGGAAGRRAGWWGRRRSGARPRGLPGRPARPRALTRGHVTSQEEARGADEGVAATHAGPLKRRSHRKPHCYCHGRIYGVLQQDVSAKGSGQWAGVGRLQNGNAECAYRRYAIRCYMVHDLTICASTAYAWPTHLTFFCLTLPASSSAKPHC